MHYNNDDDDDNLHPASALLSHIAWQSEGPRVGETLSSNHHAGVATVVAYAPSQPLYRLPELWRVRNLDSTTTSRTEIWLEDDFSQDEMPSTDPAAVTVSRLQERLAHTVETSLLPQLLVVAIVEEALHEKIQQAGAYDDGKSGTTKSSTRSNNSTEASLYYEQPKYYKVPPSQYMIPPTLQTPSTFQQQQEQQQNKSSSSQVAAGYTPSTLASRLRACTKLVHDHVEAQLYVQAYQRQQLSSTVRRSSRLPPPPPPTLPPIHQRGGRMALYVLQEKNDFNRVDLGKEAEDGTEKEKGIAVNTARTKKKKAKDQDSSSSATLPEKRERKPIPHDDNQDALEQVLQMDDSEAGSGDDSSVNNTEDEFRVEDDESDEELQVDTRVAEVHDSENESDESEEDESESDAETIADESDLIHANPYLEPTQDELLEYLGHRGKTWTAADVQDAMIHALQNKISFVPSLHLDYVALETRNLSVSRNESLHVVLECLSGETVRELKKMDPTDFARRKFLWKIALDDDDRKKTVKVTSEDKKALKLRLQMEYQEAEWQYKEERAWASWRFKGINHGYAVWPQWEEAARAHQVPRETSAAPEAPTAAVVDKEEPPREEVIQSEEASRTLAEALDSSGRRRTRRAGVSSAEGGGGGVYYGQQSTMTSKQLMDAIMRLLSSGNMQSLVSLQTLVQEESTNPLHRVRVAVGRLLWKRNQLSRCTISAVWSDARLWSILRSRLLLKPASEAMGDLPVEVVEDTPYTHHEQGNGGLVVSTGEPIRQDVSKQLEALASYLRGLHQTELQLRRMFVKLLTYVSVVVIATAADERPGSMEASDAAVFMENADSLSWESSGHSLLGKVIFRPPPGYKAKDTECQWYKVRDFVPAVELQLQDEDMTGDATKRAVLVSEPRYVERRSRFRAFPYSHEGSLVEGDPGLAVLLTEAQINAGLLAAGMQHKQSIPAKEKEVHPFPGATCQNITLRRVGGLSDQVVLARIVGHDSVLVTDVGYNVPSSLDHRILVLPDTTNASEKPGAFWASVRSDVNGNMSCRNTMDGTMYSISQSEFHSLSPAFQACRQVVEFLEHQPQSHVFAEPVDPVALNIPSYFSVVKYPMDLSTVASNLESGTYSQVLPSQNPGRHPVARMLNGPFRDDVFRIFDNAMLFNPPDDWIHLAASATKKIVAKKIEQLSREADQGLIGSHYLRTIKKSVYVDPDSDVDMYEYESDRDDDDYNGPSERQRRKRKRPSSSREEFSTQALEAPIRLQHALSETQGIRGPFADLKVHSDASEFSMSDEWTCRHKAPVVEVEVKKDPEEMKEREELSMLFELQRETEEMERAGLRRSSRAHASEQAEVYETGPVNQTANNVEFYLVKGTCPSLDDGNGLLSAERTASNRTEVEAHREAMHEEYFAVLYQRLFKRLEADEAAPYGMLSSNFFPPFLGRVLPCSGPETSQSDPIWEIRTKYIVPAVRWVLRGLINSGHLAEVEPGVILANNMYTLNETEPPFDILDMREMQRRKRATTVEEEESSEDEVEMSEYEQLRAQRVARNAERLKALGLG